MRISAQKERKKRDVNQVFNTYMCSRLKIKMLEHFSLLDLVLVLEKHEDPLVGVLGVLGVFVWVCVCRK